MEHLHALALWLTSPRGRLVAAFALFLLVALVERMPKLGPALDGHPMLKRGMTGLLTAAGAASTALMTDADLATLGEVATVAFVGGAGLNAMLGPWTKRLWPTKGKP